MVRTLARAAEERGPLLEEAAAVAIAEAGDAADLHACYGSACEERAAEGKNSGGEGGDAAYVEGDAADVVDVACDRGG